MKSLPIALLFLAAAEHGALAQSGEPAAGSSSVPEGASDAAEDVDDNEIIVEGEVPKEKRRICETQTSTGSIMPKRVCRTVAQIEEDERIARESLEIIKRDRDTRSHVQMSREQGQ